MGEDQIEGAIRNPVAPGHFMRLKPVRRPVRVTRGGLLLAESAAAVRCLEVGRDLYDPVIYVPPADLRAELTPNPHRTQCPLKGEAAYFDLIAAGDVIERIAWSYPAPIDVAAALAGLIGFYADKVTISEGAA